MATNAWVDWGQLPADIGRRIMFEAIEPDEEGNPYRVTHLERFRLPGMNVQVGQVGADVRYRTPGPWHPNTWQMQGGRARFHPNAFDSLEEARRSLTRQDIVHGRLEGLHENRADMDDRFREVNDYFYKQAMGEFYDADRRRNQIGHYAGLAAAALTFGVVGSYATKWQSDKATTNEQPGTRKAQSVQSAAHSGPDPVQTNAWYYPVGTTTTTTTT